MARPEKVRLGEILVQQKLLSEEQLNQALADQKRTGRKLGRVFVENGFVTEEQISGALARQLDIPYINLKFYNISDQLVRLLPETAARRFRALVLEDRRETVLVGVSDPTDLFAYDEIARLLKKGVELAVVNETEVLHTIDRIYRRTDEITDFAREVEADVADAFVDFGAMTANPGLEEAPVVKLLQSVFDDAAQVRASDIHIEPQEGRLQIRFRIDGVLHLQTEADIKVATPLALRLKLMADLDISEKRLPQDGRFAVKVRNQRIDVRLSTMPTQYGESVVMRLLNQAGNTLRLESIGMPRKMLERFRAIVRRPNGLVLVTGPTGSGKTTTLYSALAELNSVEKKLITVEDPVEYRLQGINQVQVNEKIELSFARVLRSALRQDPDIVLVGEMRDQETAQIGLRAAMTGHLVLSTLHTNDAPSAIMRLLELGVPDYLLEATLIGVMAQRLVRTLCPDCKTPDGELSDDVWQNIAGAWNLPKPATVYRPIGCPECRQTGYRGRTGLYELLTVSEAFTQLIGASADLQALRQQSVADGMKPLRIAGAMKIAEGVTTAEEVLKVTSALSSAS
ncbi:MAG TPA: MSHA biogenesis protein MshE [Massilia sp.]|nr:MSHA biogenesis protein MshE [Massilia sp.]